MFRIPPIKEENELLWKSRSVDGHESHLRGVQGRVLALRLPGDGVLVVPDLAVAGLQPLLHGLPLRGVQLVHQPGPLTLGHLAQLQHKELRDATVILGLKFALRYYLGTPITIPCLNSLSYPTYTPPCTAHCILSTSYFYTPKLNYKQYVQKLHRFQTGPCLDTDIEQSFIAI